MRRVLLLAVWLAAVLVLSAAGPGFRSAKHLDDHYRKHGHEFGEISKAEYLRFAQELRDAKAEGPIVEALRKDSVITRFHRKKGWFIAFERNRVIRTFFIPVQGEQYFWRQAKR
jgi:pyocin large subunit-like protein